MSYRKSGYGPNPNSPEDTFYRRLTMVMVTQGVSYRQLQRETGVRRETICKRQESGVLPSGGDILKLCNYFRVSADWLMGFSSDITGYCKFKKWGAT